MGDSIIIACYYVISTNPDGAPEVISEPFYDIVKKLGRYKCYLGMITTFTFNFMCWSSILLR